MEIVAQNFKTGLLSVDNVPPPIASNNQIVVRVHASLISVGTDRSIIALGKKGPLGKALDRPDLAKKVINRAKIEGFWPTFKVVQNLISEPIPLGYSLVGTVIEVGKNITDLAIGDRVACAGLGYANHAEIISVPRNLCTLVPAEVSDENAAYVTMGAIAMHGIRQANQQIGSSVLVVGLGLVGQLTVQLCNAAGMSVIGIDIDERKLDLARAGGAIYAAKSSDKSLKSKIMDVTEGFGVDSVILTAGSKNSGTLFGKIVPYCRDRARVVVVGDNKMDIDRRAYFEKELDIVQSRSYGPGRYDKNYEENGHDYPIGYVRWTERRNFSSFLSLINNNKINPSILTTHRFSISDAPEAYDIVTSKNNNFAVGIVLEYDTEKVVEKNIKIKSKALKNDSKIGLGIIGSGTFAKGILLPSIIDTGGFKVEGVVSGRGISAKNVAEKYQAAFAYSNSEELFENKNVKAIVVSTRHDSHAKFVIQALKKDIHVFVEKPLALNIAELVDVEKAAHESNATLTVGFNRRHAPLVNKMKDFFSGRSEPVAMIYRVNSGRIPLKSELSWVHDPEVGGGRIIGECCHFIDTMRYLCDEEPVSVQASSVNLRRPTLSCDDIITFTVTFSKGSTGTVHYFSNGCGNFPKERLEMFGEEKIGILDNFRTLELASSNGINKKKSLSVDKGFNNQAKYFLNACKTGEPLITIDSLVSTTQSTFAIANIIRGVEQ